MVLLVIITFTERQFSCSSTQAEASATATETYEISTCLFYQVKSKDMKRGQFTRDN